MHNFKMLLDIALAKEKKFQTDRNNYALIRKKQINKQEKESNKNLTHKLYWIL